MSLQAIKAINDRHNAVTSGKTYTNVQPRPTAGKRLFVFGDSHAKGLAHVLQMEMPETDVFVCSNPGAGSDYVLKNAEAMARNLNKNDTGVLIVGTNDLAECTQRHTRPATTLSGRLHRFVRSNQHTNWIVTSVLHRHDLPKNSFFNKMTRMVNSDVTDGSEDFSVIDVSGLHRRNFTSHGLHLNKRGKKVLCGWIRKTVERRVEKPEQPQDTRASKQPSSPRPSEVNSQVNRMSPPPLSSMKIYPPLQQLSPASTTLCSESEVTVAGASSIPVHVAPRFLGLRQLSESLV